MITVAVDMARLLGPDGDDRWAAMTLTSLGTELCGETDEILCVASSAEASRLSRIWDDLDMATRARSRLVAAGTGGALAAAERHGSPANRWIAALDGPVLTRADHPAGLTGLVQALEPGKWRLAAHVAPAFTAAGLGRSEGGRAAARAAALHAMEGLPQGAPVSLTLLHRDAAADADLLTLGGCACFAPEGPGAGDPRLAAPPLDLDPGATFHSACLAAIAARRDGSGPERSLISAVLGQLAGLDRSLAILFAGVRQETLDTTLAGLAALGFRHKLLIPESFAGHLDAHERSNAQVVADAAAAGRAQALLLDLGDAREGADPATTLAHARAADRPAEAPAPLVMLIEPQQGMDGVLTQPLALAGGRLVVGALAANPDRMRRGAPVNSTASAPVRTQRIRLSAPASGHAWNDPEWVRAGAPVLRNRDDRDCWAWERAQILYALSQTAITPNRLLLLCARQEPLRNALSEQWRQVDVLDVDRLFGDLAPGNGGAVHAASQDGYDAVVAPHASLFRAGLAGLGAAVATLRPLLRPDGALVIGAETALTPAAAASRPTPQAAGPDGFPAIFDAALGMTPDDLGSMATGPEDRVGLSGAAPDLWPAVWAFRPRHGVDHAGAEAVAVALSRLQLGDVSPMLRLGPGATRAPDGRISVTPGGEAGHAVFGPYLQLAPGRHRIALDVVGDGGGRRRGTIAAEAALDLRTVARRAFRLPRPNGRLSVELDFAVETMSTFELRIWTEGDTAFTITKARTERACR